MSEVQEQNTKEIMARIEAALYSAGRPLDAQELARAAGISSLRKAIMIAREIARLIRGSLNAIEIVEYPGPRFAMQLKSEYNTIARRFATRPLLSKAALRTLSYIAYFQPITSSELALRRSKSVYKHLKELEEIGFIVGERQGRSKVYRTTNRFSDYFGLSNDPLLMKKQLESKTLSLG